MQAHTKLNRLKSIDRKLHGANPKHVERWCQSRICGCIGAANCSLRDKVSFANREEWVDYVSWLDAGKPEHTNFKLRNNLASLSEKEAKAIMDNTSMKLIMKEQSPPN